ncbi:MAG: hypothetical protein R2705_13695 [Ilumatobacteraceae bacterium]
MNGIGSGGAGDAPRRPADARELIDLADQIGSEHLSVESLAGARRRALITACAALVLFVVGIALAVRSYTPTAKPDSVEAQPVMCGPNGVETDTNS